MQLWSKEEGGITRLVTSCVIKHVIEGKIDGSDGKTRKRRKRLLDNLNETRGCWKLKEEALDRTLWRTRCGRGYAPVVRQTMG